MTDPPSKKLEIFESEFKQQQQHHDEYNNLIHGPTLASRGILCGAGVDDDVEEEEEFVLHITTQEGPLPDDG